MRFEKKIIGAVCAICGAALLNAGQPHSDCQPKVELCAPAAKHLDDDQHRDPAPQRTRAVIEILASSTASFEFVRRSSVPIYWRKS